MRRRNKKIYLNTSASHIGFLSKIIIVILAFGMIIGHINVVAFAKMFKPKMDTIINEDINRDFSLIGRVEEVVDLRTKDSKTYLKKNGMYETEIYNEQIHYLKDGSFQEIDNTLSLENNQYMNLNNAYQLVLPKHLNDNEYFSLTYLNYGIKIYYNLQTSAEGQLSKGIDRTKANLKDEIIYTLNNQEKIQYILQQNSIKENIILNSYIENYQYTYYIDTTLRLERVGNEIHFFDQQQLVFVMNEYYMYDTYHQDSNDIEFAITTVDVDTYQITVTPSNEFLSQATYPVVIDPEIELVDGGVIDGISSVHAIDKQEGTSDILTLGSFTLANRDNSSFADDAIAQLHIYIPRDYTSSIGDIITRNQLMYANITLNTLNTNANGDTKVNMRYGNYIIDSVEFHNSNVFDHQFNIYDAVTDKLESFKTNDMNLSFELSVEGVNHTEVTYALGGYGGGKKPVITLGYIDEAGLADYYTYESLPLNTRSNIYIAHNSGNLIYIYNDYTDNQLLNLSHIYNANRKYNQSIYGNGFRLSYNEELTINYSTITLTEANGRSVLFYPMNTNKNEYIAADGSGDILTKQLDSSHTVTEYEIQTSDGAIKIYNHLGKLIQIYTNKNDRVDGQWSNDAKFIKLIYTNDQITRVEDSYGNYMIFTYLSIANTPTEEQQGTPYLAYIEVYKKDPTITAANQMVKVLYTEFEYMYGNLIAISEYKETPQGKHTYFSYDDNDHISKIHQNDNGYTFTYDHQNRVTKANVYSTKFTNGDYLDFIYNKNGKKTIVINGSGESTSYTFDDYNHTNSVETMSGYTTFYQYEDIYFDGEGYAISSPNYNKNHHVIVQSNQFKNVANPIVNHGFEVEIGSNIYGWTKDVTNGSNATIEKNTYLFGSKVLKLYKSSTGRARVYQDIDIISGKQYIIQGYIKNTHNNGTGAYIDVVGLNGEITPTSQSPKIKNLKDFNRYEYKFTANYTGKARIYLINDSIGYTYFDQIQINTNYLDTRYNYLENSSFENASIGGWNGYNYIVTTTDQDIFQQNCGNQVLKLATNGYIKQRIDSPGLAGDTFVFGGYCFYENYTGKVSVQLNFVDENEPHSKQFIFNGNDINAVYKMSNFTAPCDYIAVEIEIRNLSDSSYANIDNFAVYKEGYGLHLMYSDEGNLTEEYDENRDTKTNYIYDENGHLIKVITNDDTSNINASGDVTDITYQGDVISTIQNKNITSVFETDSDGNIIKATSTTTNTSIQQYYGSTTYTADGLYPVTSKDVFGNITTSTYDYLTGLVTKVVDSDNKFTEYTYDEAGNVLKIINGKWNNKKIVTYTYDGFGNLSTITTDGLTYTFIYNDYGDLKSISMGDEVVVTNHYQNETDFTEVYTGKLNHTSYSYGTIYFEYDEENRIKNIYYQSSNGDKEKVLEYMYNDYNEVASYIDLKENVTYYYNYDYQNRLINVNATNGNNITYTYDNGSKLVNKTNINGTNTYIYGDVSPTDEENKKIIGEHIADKWNIGYGYSNDSFAQLETISYYISTTSIDKNYTYETSILDGNTYYTGRIKELEYVDGNNGIIKYVYTYDKNNNITNIAGYKNGILVYQEENNYDIFNQITMQYMVINNQEFGSEYLYDSRGNILSYYVLDIRTNQYIYNYQFTYQTTGNKDKLYKIESLTDNQTYYIEYSSVGEPSLYLGWTIGYDMKSIATLINTEYEINYSYNANGLRIGKTISKNNDTTHILYTLDGSNIIKEVRSGTTNETLQYFYDSSENIIGFTYNNVKYLYLKNLQNDIIGIVDSNHNIIVEYYYDAYGRLIHMVDTSDCNLGTINPFRYRSYYQDNETGWYYLNSRYYDANICRFITMDDIDYLGASGSVLSYNLFSYCENNPVVHIDTEGNWLARVVCGVIGATAFALLANVVCRILGLDARTRTIVTIAFGALGGIIGAVLGPSFLAKHAPKLLKAIQEIEKRKFSLKAIGPNLYGNIFGIVISNVLIIMLHSPHPKYNEWYFHIQVEVKLEGKHQVTIFKYPLLYVNPGKWGK